MKFVHVILLMMLSVVFAFSTNLEEVEQYIRARTSDVPVPVHSHCGFRHQLELQQNYHLLNPELQSLAKTLLVKPQRALSVISPSGYFELHYDTSGVHAVNTEDVSGNGIPDYVDSAAVYLDYARQVEVEQLGFKPPPDSDGQPIDLYPVYFTSFGYYGLTSFNTDEDIAALPGNNYTSYLELHKNFNSSQFYTNGLEALKVTIAHELNHAVQLGYNFRIVERPRGGYDYPDLFFMEMTSTWLEDYVFEDVNDYVQYVNKYIPQARHKSFNAADGNTEYAGATYLIMLAKMFEPAIVAGIWEKIQSERALDALESVLGGRGYSFAESHNDYASWLYFTGSRSDADQFFEDGALFSEIAPVDSIQAGITDLKSFRMEHYYINVSKSTSYTGRVFSSPNTGMFNFLNNGMFSNPARLFGKPLSFPQNRDLPCVLVLTNPTTETLTGIEYSVKKGGAGIAGNPVAVYSGKERVTFFNVPFSSRVYVFTVNGRLVTDFENELSGDSPLDWDLRDRFQNRVASGVYLYVVSGSGSTSTGKFAVVRE